MTGAGASVLVVDDEYLIAMALSLTLEDMGLRVCATAATAAKAVELAELHRPQLVLMDVRLKGKTDGVEAAIAIHRSTQAAVIFITGSREPETLARIHQDHPAEVLFKPILPMHLKTAVNKVLQRGAG